MLGNLVFLARRELLLLRGSIEEPLDDLQPEQCELNVTHCGAVTLGMLAASAAAFGTTVMPLPCVVTMD